MAGLFERLFRQTEKQNDPGIMEVEIPPIAVEKPFAAIGDIHGCDDLLARLLEKLSNEAPNAELLFVGDYIDRGEQSAQVLRRLMDFEGAYCLLGNHERMCLDFIDHPEEKGPRWLRNGGLQTIASFGVQGAANEPVALRDQMVAAMGNGLISWLRELPLVYENGNIRAVHAAAHPEKPIEGQGEKPLIWGHPKFGRLPRRDGLWVVHGHTIVDVPKVLQGVVSIDTGAYATGRLTAAVFAGNDVQFVQA
jgi:serine/threonine protein phosphatase 1